MAEEAFIAQELVQITDTLEVTPGNAITEWRLYISSTKSTSRVRIVEDATARLAQQGREAGDYT